MTLDTSKPEDSVEVSEIPSYIRENRVAINAAGGGAEVGETNLTISTGTTSLVVGTDLGIEGYETVKVTGDGVSTIQTISKGTDGQVKVFIFQDSNINIVDGNVKLGGVFYLNHLPAGSIFEPDQDDILAVRNIGGDGDTVPGYWKELYRSLSVK